MLEMVPQHQDFSLPDSVVSVRYCAGSTAVSHEKFVPWGVTKSQSWQTWCCVHRKTYSWAKNSLWVPGVLAAHGF